MKNSNPAIITAEKKRHGKGKMEPRIFHTLNYSFLTILCLVMLYPMLNTLAVSLNEGMDVIRGGIYIWPRMFTLVNYRIVLDMHTIYDSFFMSVYRTVVAVITNLFFTSILAFAISRREYILGKFITVVFVLTMYFDAGLIPNFLLIQSLGMLNTFTVYWLPGLVSAFNLIVMRTYMRTVSESLIESARIDGAGDFRVYWQIVMPLCKPVIATIALFVAVNSWNAWFDTFIYNSGAQHLSVLQYELQRLLASTMIASGQTGQQAATTMQAQIATGASITTPIAIRATITIVAAVPILLVYPFLQRYFVHGMQLGGIKE